MRTSLKFGLSLAVVLGFMVLAQADDKKADGKAQKLTGTVTCAKCDLKIAKDGKCHTVIKVKDTVYWFDAASSKKYHKPICTTPTEGTVTGVVSEKDGKKIIKVSKVELNK
ncbi:MAG TPA: DUF6370 family protein [Gemmataceae bacterium]|nr:DUF6370 family protein [Gemmataceae bacterium]